MTRIKICGLRCDADIAAVNNALPDLIGFVFAPSRRQLGAEQATRLKAQLDPRIAAVGVFVDAPIEQLAILAETGVIDIAQLHGKEDEEFIHALRQRCDLPIIKAVKVRSVDDLTTAAATASSADYLLLDGGAGAGERFDWSLLSCAETLPRPWLLAGGLELSNLQQALALQPWGLDVSSGVESNGVKDAQKILAFVQAVRAATRQEESVSHV